MTSRVATVRSERGYSATKYDASVVPPPKKTYDANLSNNVEINIIERLTLEQKYDAKKVRNTYSQPLYLATAPS